MLEYPPKGGDSMKLDFNETVKNFLEYQKSNLKFQSYLKVERDYKLHIIPYFENKNIEDITKKDILNWTIYIQNKELSSSTKSHIKTEFDRFYDYLILYYDFTSNLSRSIPNFKKTFSDKSCQNVWTIKEFNKFIKCCKNDIEYYTLFYFLFYTGLRLGEVLALQWKDLDTKKVIISKSLSESYKDGKRIIQSTKNNHDREKCIDFFTYQKLMRLRNYYIKKFSDFNNNFYIFGANKNLACTTIRRKKNFYCKLAGVKQIRIHDFRHSRGSIVYQKTKNIKIVQEELGHIDANVTINTYVHAFEKDKKRANLLLNLIHFRLF